MNRLQERLKLVNDKLQGFANCEELDDVAQEVMACAVDIANGNTPEDLLIVAHWLRTDMNIRMTPQVLLVLASRLDATKQFVRKYAPSIVIRPDEVKTCLLLHRFFFGSKTIKNCLAMGLADATAKFGERHPCNTGALQRTTRRSWSPT